MVVLTCNPWAFWEVEAEGHSLICNEFEAKPTSVTGDPAWKKESDFWIKLYFGFLD